MIKQTAAPIQVQWWKWQCVHTYIWFCLLMLYSETFILAEYEQICTCPPTPHPTPPQSGTLQIYSLLNFCCQSLKNEVQIDENVNLRKCKGD
jgi:hypothetical protein